MTVDQGQIGQIPDQRQTFRARGSDVLQGGLEILGLDVTDGNPRPFPGQGLRNRTTEASSCAENESGLAAQTQVHQCLST